MLDLTKIEITTKTHNPNFLSAFEEMIADIRVRGRAESTVKQYECVLRRMTKYGIAEMRQSDIKKAHILALRDAVAADSSIPSSGQVIAVISSVFITANRMSDLPINNPAHGVTKLTSTPKRVIFHAADMPKLREAFRQPPSHQKCQLYALLLTGLRFNSMRHIRVDDVDWDNGLLRVRELKGKPKGATLPVSSMAMEWLAAAREIQEQMLAGSEYRFVSTQSRGRPIRASWYTAVKEVIPKLAPHSMRRTFASALSNVDCPHYTLKKLLCHSAGADVTSLYVSPDVSVMRDWSERAGEWLCDAMEG